MAMVSFNMYSIAIFVRNFLGIAHFQSYPSILAASCWIGLNKGLRTVFMALVIPSYIPLNRLPGATGLQLLFAGIFYFFMGPVIGKSYIDITVNTYICAACKTRLYHPDFFPSVV